MIENPQTSGHHSSDDPALAAARAQGHEGEGLFVRRIVVTAVSLFLLTVASLGIVALVMYFSENPDASPVKAAEEWRRRASDPGVTPDQTAMREATERRMQQLLSEYRWQDEDQRVARIPIERAMELLAAKNFQVTFSPPAPTTGENDEAPSTQEAKP